MTTSTHTQVRRAHSSAHRRRLHKNYSCHDSVLYVVNTQSVCFRQAALQVLGVRQGLPPAQRLPQTPRRPRKPQLHVRRLQHDIRQPARRRPAQKGNCQPSVAIKLLRHRLNHAAGALLVAYRVLQKILQVRSAMVIFTFHFMLSADSVSRWH